MAAKQKQIARRRSENHRVEGRYRDDSTERTTPKGERTLQRVSMSDEMAEQLDTLHWMRAEAWRIGNGQGSPPVKENLYDEAVSSFLKRQAKGDGVQYAYGAPKPKYEYGRNMWLDTGLVECCRELSENHGVKMKLLMRRVFAEYIEHAVPKEWIEFRRRVGEAAVQMLKAWPNLPDSGVRVPRVPARAKK